jgi:pimeloyl-ACP methyl ester carboxylesterase
MRFALGVGSVLVLATTPAFAQLGCPPASGRMVSVAPNVRLHVVEWGGRGETLILLSGLAASAHAFDDFARLFVDRFRVVGITRRGIPPSDSSTTGYGASQVTADIVAVMDSLKIRRAHLVGWSFGGDEAVMVAVNHQTRVRSVVLLDSYDNSVEAATFKATENLKTPAARWTALDSSSAVALTWRARRLGYKPLPVSFFCALYKFGPDGRLIGRAVPGARYNAIRAGMPKLPYASVRQPVLAFFHVSRAVSDDYPEYSVMDSTDKMLATNAFRPESLAYASARHRARTEMPHARIVELLGAPHEVFAYYPEIIVPEMVAFFNRIRSSSK